MPPSQLKRLKASLHAAGVIGNQKTKKEKKKNVKSGADARVDKHSKLQSIREEFNPFEIKTTRTKHDVSGRGKIKGVQGRPGISKQIGEETRKKTLLVEMHKRNKAGGIIDRRFGENDPSMAPEDRMLERFTREKQARLRNGDIFNLDDDDVELTHFGQSLGGLNEFDQGDMLSDGDEFAHARKRAIEGVDNSDGDSGVEGEPAKKKSRAEAMKEVIAKSKLHKYERQKTKEEDEDIREELDAQMGEIWQLLAGPRVAQAPPPPSPKLIDGIDSGRFAMINGDNKDEENKKYDTAVKEMLFDKRSKPAERTKTAEEKALEEAERLKNLEEARLRRMRGEADSDDDNGQKSQKNEDEDEDEDEEDEDYGFGKGIPKAGALRPEQQPNPDELVDGDYEYDDNFEDLGGDSGAEHSDDYDSDVSEPLPGSDDEEFDAEFLADVLPDKTGKQKKVLADKSIEEIPAMQDTLAFTYPCPATHGEFLTIVQDIPVEDLPTVIHRIRVLHNPKLAEGNKEKLANFSMVLLEHIIHVGNCISPIPFAVVETAIRHLHALAKQYPLKISEALRTRLDALHQKPTGEITAGDLLMLTAIGTIYPTSDHFHPVVTPASLIMAKYLAQHPPNSLGEMAIGTYIATLLIKGQQLSKRVIPEAINYILLSLCLLSPVPLPSPLPGDFPFHEPEESLRITNPLSKWTPRKPSFSDMFNASSPDTNLAIMNTLLQLLANVSNLYVGKSAYTPIFAPAKEIVAYLLSPPDLTTTPSLPDSLTDLLTSTLTTLNAHLTHAHRTLRPLELHHHRPLPIPSNIPKFHEEYSLDKRSYDPDRERVALQKLKAEHKKERKGALRELRKDAAFIAREKLKEEKATSKEYHAKMARLTAMIQHEEGQGKNEYEREKRARKGKK